MPWMPIAGERVKHYSTRKEGTIIAKEDGGFRVRWDREIRG